MDKLNNIYEQLHVEEFEEVSSFEIMQNIVSRDTLNLSLKLKALLRI